MKRRVWIEFISQVGGVFTQEWDNAKVIISGKHGIVIVERSVPGYKTRDVYQLVNIKHIEESIEYEPSVPD